MTGCFGDGVERLAGAAAALLGWRPNEFWSATPAELAAALRGLAGDERAPLDLAAMMERHPDG